MLQDFRYAVRMLLKDPWFTAAAVLTLGLSIGANSALFSLVNRVLFSPLPFKDPEGIVILQTHVLKNDGRSAVSGPNFLDWKQRTHTLQDLSVMHPNCQFILTGSGEPVSLKGVRVSPSFFPLYGVPLIGPGLRTLAADKSQPPGDDKVVVITHRLWQQRFAGDPNLIGRKLIFNGEEREVVGVLPRTLGFIEEMTDLMVPVLDDALKENRGANYLQVFGRLKPGVSLAQARADMSAVAKQLEKDHPDYNTGYGIRIVRLHDELVKDVKTAFLVLHAVVAFVLLIACVNLASLLLTRSAARNKEMAIRAALGAGHARIIRQLLTESVLLGLIGGALGVALACWGVSLLKAMAPQMGGMTVPLFEEMSIDGRVLIFTAGISLLSGLAFGLVPALQAAKPNLQQVLKESDRSVSGTRQRHRILAWFTVGEVALSLVVLTCAGLMIHSYYRAQKADPGFDPRNLLCLETDLPFYKYGAKESRVAFYQQVLERVAALPGVESVALNNLPPLRMINCGNVFEVEGRPPAAPGEWLVSEYRLVNADYFQAMRIPLKNGRHFSAQNHAGSAPEMIINEAMARQFFGRENPVGKRIKIPGEAVCEVVGLVGDEKFWGPTSRPLPMMYQPFHQNCWNRMTVAIRTAHDNPLSLASAVQRVIWSVDKDQPISRTTSMEQSIASSMSVNRFVLVIFCLFGAVTLLLAAIGVYGVMSYSVNQRTNEIGIRIALGATSRNILLLVMSQGVVRAGLGLGIGLALAIGVTRVLSGLLYETSATEPVALAAVAVSLAAVALLACYLPARRALRVDPAIALRYE
jgi:putative ABC transport system permease protein